MIGIVEGKLGPCPDTPNCVSSQSQDPNHFVEPIQCSTSLLEAKNALLQVLTTMARVKVMTETENYIHATFTSLIFRFVDDVEFHLVDSPPVIHVRSASRLGYSDLGVNRKRIEEIRKAFASSSHR